MNLSDQEIMRLGMLVHFLKEKIVIYERFIYSNDKKVDAEELKKINEKILFYSNPKNC